MSQDVNSNCSYMIMICLVCFNMERSRVCLHLCVSVCVSKISTGNFPPHHCDVRLEQLLLSDWMAVNSVLTPNAR